MSEISQLKNPIGEALYKKWDECTIEEKIDKLRDEMRNMRHMQTSINNLHRDVESLLNHEHGAKGDVMTKLKKHYGSSESGIVSRYDVLN